jgi:DNA-cytosine methyltransferase
MIKKNAVSKIMHEQKEDCGCQLSTLRRLQYISLFSGIGGFECAIQTVFPTATCVGFSEIHKHALQVYAKNHPNHPALGDITNIKWKKFQGNVDLVVGGSPCQDLSPAKGHTGKRKGLKGAKSRLFWEFVRCIQEVRPRFFILENVARMNKKDSAVISETLKCQPVILNSRHFTGQNRKRAFWCNFLPPDNKFNTPQEKAFTWTSLLQPRPIVEEFVHTEQVINFLYDDSVEFKGHAHGTRRMDAYPYYSDTRRDYCQTLGAYMKYCYQNVLFDYRFHKTNPLIRKFTPVEIERLQGFPDEYTEGLSATQRYHVLGNAVTVPVIRHLCLLLLEKIRAQDVRESREPVS